MSELGGAIAAAVAPDLQLAVVASVWIVSLVGRSSSDKCRIV